MEEKRDLYAYVCKETSTLRVMDEFEGINDKPYDRLIIKNLHKANIAGKYLCNYHLIIERLSYDKVRDAEGNITFTEFKNNPNPVYGYIAKILEKLFDSNKRLLKKKKLYFKRPYLLRAQSSMNRTGYGWDWDWSGGYGNYTEGTFYGETNNYGFVGIIIDSASVIKENTKDKQDKDDICLENRIVPEIKIVNHMHKKYFKIYKSESESFLIPYNKKKKTEDILKIYYSYLDSE